MLEQTGGQDGDQGTQTGHGPAGAANIGACVESRTTPDDPTDGV